MEENIIEELHYIRCSQNNLLWYLKNVDFALDKVMGESLMPKICL